VRIAWRSQLDRPEREAVLAEVGRVMRPEGRLVVVTVAPPRSQVLVQVLDRIDADRFARRTRVARQLSQQPAGPAAEIEQALVRSNPRHIIRGTKRRVLQPQLPVIEARGAIPGSQRRPASRPRLATTNGTQ
jgi:hypothetical protein